MEKKVLKGVYEMGYIWNACTSIWQITDYLFFFMYLSKNLYYNLAILKTLRLHLFEIWCIIQEQQQQQQHLKLWLQQQQQQLQQQQ